jgi:hypothetical protein
MSTNRKITIEIPESTVRALAGKGLSPETTGQTLLRHMGDAPPEVVALVSDQFGDNIWSALTAQVQAKTKKETTPDVGFNLSAADRKAFADRTTRHPLAPLDVTRRLFQQFLNAPEEIPALLAGGSGNIWADYALKVRNTARAEMAPEMALAEAVRVVALAKNLNR